MPLNVLPTKVITEVPNLGLKGKELKRQFRAWMNSVDKEVAEQSKQILQDTIRFTDSVATGRLLDSVTTRLMRNSNVDGFTRVVGFKKPGSNYAYFANYGREAGGVPPYRAILNWARARGIDTDRPTINRIRWSIARYGTEEDTDGERGHRFMEVAEPIIERKAKTLIRNKVKEFTRNRK